MPSDLPLSKLHEWCQLDRLVSIGTSALSIQDWESGLSQRIAALEPGTIDTPNANGVSALERLASYRPRRNKVKSVLAQGVEQLLAAGANPLSGKPPAILQGQRFTEDLAVNKMLSALTTAQKAGSPYRTDNDNNLFHAMVYNDIGAFAYLAQDGCRALDGCGDVVAAWRDEVDAQGKTPVELAWEQYPTSRPGMAEGESDALWSLLLPGERGIWQPPSLDMQCADGQLLYQRVLSKVDQGMPVTPRAEGLVEKLRAMVLAKDLARDTPEVSTVVSPRTPRL